METSKLNWLISPALFWTLSFLILTPFFIWTYLTETMNSNTLNTFSKKSILIIIAHPDDECMFFSPTIQSLSKISKVHLLCLSIGNDQGLGSKRQLELESSCKILGINNFKCLDDSKLPDSMTIQWSNKDIVKHIKTYMKSHQIDQLITFDDYGVSGHTNHISIYHAVSDAIDQGIFKQKLYTLQSVPIMIKYSFLFGAFWTKLNAKEDSTRIWFISTVTEYINGRLAMYQHESQMVWFRHLYLFTSRYMILNELHVYQGNSSKMTSN